MPTCGVGEVYQKSPSEGGQVQCQGCIYKQVHMEKEKLLVSNTEMSHMIRPGHGKMCSIFLVTDTFSNLILALKLLGVRGSSPALNICVIIFTVQAHIPIMSHENAIHRNLMAVPLQPLTLPCSWCLRVLTKVGLVDLAVGNKQFVLQ